MFSQALFYCYIAIFEYIKERFLCQQWFGKFCLTVTFLREQANWIIKADISRARNQQVMLTPLFQMTYRGSLVNKSTC
ncbi:MAG: hypothetical protein D3916_10865 [Candidatus Electrothrix sp. MAN1_4]|nr:hypothetical protein [Candidatus Electrothrix sp. MAN1_4]